MAPGLDEEDSDSAADLDREPPDWALASSAALGDEVEVCRMEEEERRAGVAGRGRGERSARRRRVEVKRCIVVVTCIDSVDSCGRL
jgi:hypothetical protein